MKILIVYASTEGQTRKIARYAFDWLSANGHQAELIGASEAEGLDPRGFDAAILAGSVHGGRYQDTLVAYGAVQSAALAAKPTLFLSVSLSAAGDDAEDRAGLEQCVARFVAETGWTPGQVAHVAGALMYSEYDFFRYWAMRWIAAQRDDASEPGKDLEYTDWEALGALLADWTRRLGAGT